MNATVVVPRDIYGLSWEDGKPTPRRIHRKGDRITLEEAQAAGLLPIESAPEPVLETK